MNLFHHFFVCFASLSPVTALFAKVLALAPLSPVATFFSEVITIDCVLAACVLAIAWDEHRATTSV